MSNPSYTNEPWLTLSRVIETTADLVLLRFTFANPYALPLAMGWYALHFTAMFLWTELDKTNRPVLPQQPHSDEPIDLGHEHVIEAMKAADNVDIYQYRLSYLSKQFYKDMVGGLSITTASSLLSDRMMKLISTTIHPLLLTSGFLLIPLLSKLYYNYVYLEDTESKDNFIESLLKHKYIQERESQIEKAQTENDADDTKKEGLFSSIRGNIFS